MTAKSFMCAASGMAKREARAVGEDIENLQRKDHKLDEMAILVRASFQMREFEDRFITLGLPYRVIGGPKFYERAEIRDALAYLKVTAQPDHDLAFERIINVPKRSIGDASVKKLHGFARQQGISLYRAAQAMVETDELTPKTRNSLSGLLQTFSRWRALIDGHPPCRAGRDHPGRVRLYRDVAERPRARRAGAA